jgi:hypothetical protein
MALFVTTLLFGTVISRLGAHFEHRLRMRT